MLVVFVSPYLYCHVGFAAVFHNLTLDDDAGNKCTHYPSPLLHAPRTYTTDFEFDPLYHSNTHEPESQPMAEANADS